MTLPPQNNLGAAPEPFDRQDPIERLRGTIPQLGAAGLTGATEAFIESIAESLDRLATDGLNLSNLATLVAATVKLPIAHDLAGAQHNADTLADLNSKVSDATLDNVNTRDVKQDVVMATVSAGTLATDFENGDTVDGVLLITGDRILIKDQASNVENGIYIVNASGAPTRAADMATGSAAEGAVIFVIDGAALGDSGWFCTNNVGDALVGTNGLVFKQFSIEFNDGGETRGKNRTLGNKDSFDLALITGNAQRLIARANGNIEIVKNLKRSVTAGITAFATGGQASATALTEDVNEVSIVATTGDSVKLLSAAVGLTQTVINNGANAMDVFPNTGDDLGSGVDTAQSLAAGSNITYVAYDATNWESV